MNAKRVIALIDYAKFALAGAIGGLAIVNTYDLLIGAAVTDSIESVAMASGAAILAGLVKILHVV
jgi:hypothetical protein